MEWLDGPCYDDSQFELDRFITADDQLAGSSSDGFSPSLLLDDFMGCSSLSSSCSTFTESMTDIPAINSAPVLSPMPQWKTPQASEFVQPATSPALTMPSDHFVARPNNEKPVEEPKPSSLKKQKGKPVRKKRLLLKTLKELPKDAYDELTLMSAKEMRYILSLNEQDTSGSKTDLMVRIADCYLRGCLPICPKCKERNLIETNVGTYYCNIAPDVETDCDYQCANVVRKPWKVRANHSI